MSVVRTGEQLGTVQRVTAMTVDVRHRSTVTQVGRPVLHWTQLAVATLHTRVHHRLATVQVLGRWRIFTALHGMQRGLTMRFLSVRPSVRLSVCQTRAL